MRTGSFQCINCLEMSVFARQLEAVRFLLAILDIILPLKTQKTSSLSHSTC